MISPANGGPSMLPSLLGGWPRNGPSSGPSFISISKASPCSSSFRHRCMPRSSYTNRPKVTTKPKIPIGPRNRRSSSVRVLHPLEQKECTGTRRPRKEPQKLRAEFSYFCVAVVDLLVGKFEMVRGLRPDRCRCLIAHLVPFWERGTSTGKVPPYGSSEAPRCRETVLEAPEPSHGDWRGPSPGIS